MPAIAATILCFVGCLTACSRNLRASDSEIDNAISKHEDAIAKLRSFHVRADVYCSMSEGATLTLASNSVWIIDGRMERIEDLPIETRYGSTGKRSSQSVEVVIKDNKVFELLNWGRNNPPLITPANQGDVKAQIRNQTDRFVMVDPSMDTLLRPRVNVGYPRSTLSELVKRFGKREFVDSDEAIRLRLTDDSGKFVGPREALEVVISKKAGYLVSKLSLIVDVEKSEHARRDITVRSFKEIQNGMYFPEVVTSSRIDSSSREIPISRWELKSITSINEPIESRVFELVFPEDCLVIDSTSIGEVKWCLWGPDNQPVREVANRDELLQIEEIYNEVSGNNSSLVRNWKLLLVAVGCLLGLSYLVWYWIGRRQAKPS